MGLWKTFTVTSDLLFPMYSSIIVVSDASYHNIQGINKMGSPDKVGFDNKHRIFSIHTPLKHTYGEFLELVFIII